MWHLAWRRHVSALALIASQPVLSKVYTDFRTLHSLSRETDRSVHARGVCILNMAEQSATALAAIQSHLSDLSTSRKKLDDHLFRALAWKTADPDSSTIIWLLLLWLRPVLAHTVSCDGLVFCVI